MGLISLQQADPVRIAAPLLPELASRTGQTVALVVWGTRGPTIVLREASPSAVHVDMRHGTVFSIVGTASGRLFAANLAADVVRPVYEAERRAAPRADGGDAQAWPAWPQLQRELVSARCRHRCSTTAARWCWPSPRSGRRPRSTHAGRGRSPTRCAMQHARFPRASDTVQQPAPAEPQIG
jgi:DNA-binding IclR family transcriptional regulator